MARTIDVRGLSCPEPVIVTKRALDEQPKAASCEPLLVLVDTNVAAENIKRLVTNQGYSFSKTEVGDEYEISITRR